MKNEIVIWCERMAEKYGLTCIYLSSNECYSFTKRGMGVQNFTLGQFYGVPKRERENMLLALVKSGLNHNIGEAKMRNQLSIPWKLGKLIARFG